MHVKDERKLKGRSLFLGRKHLTLVTSLFLLTALFSSCDAPGGRIAVIKTNRPEFAAYAELFNMENDKWKVAVVYSENPAEELLLKRVDADIVAGPWIKGEKTRSRLLPLTYLFNEMRLAGSLFYRSLLELGNIRGTQFSLPVSFNLPALIFFRENRSSLSDDTLITLEEIKELSRAFNEGEGDVYTRMAFSPRWNTEFLYIAAQMMNADFREADTSLSWNEENLAGAIAFLRDWETSINTSAEAAEDFKFKYLYVPFERAAAGGRILFSQVYTDELFSGSQNKMRQIDFRWPCHNGMIPLKDEIVYLGIYREARNKAAAEAFVEWFFKEETQQRLLEYSKDVGLLKNTFGVAGGFSALKGVNEMSFPLYYPELLGKMPKEEELKIPEILPNDWETLRQEIILPYLSEITAAPAGTDVLALNERLERIERAH